MLAHGEISNPFTKEHLELMINATAACAPSHSKRVYKPLLTVYDTDLFTRQQHGEGFVLEPNAKAMEELDETEYSEDR